MHCGEWMKVTILTFEVVLDRYRWQEHIVCIIAPHAFTCCLFVKSISQETDIALWTLFISIYELRIIYHPAMA